MSDGISSEITQEGVQVPLVFQNRKYFSYCFVIFIFHFSSCSLFMERIPSVMAPFLYLVTHCCLSSIAILTIIIYPLLFVNLCLLDRKFNSIYQHLQSTQNLIPAIVADNPLGHFIQIRSSLPPTCIL